MVFGAAVDEFTDVTKDDKVYVEGVISMNTWKAADGTEKHGMSVSYWRAGLQKIGRHRPCQDRTENAPARHARAAAGPFRRPRCLGGGTGNRSGAMPDRMKRRRYYGKCACLDCRVDTRRVEGIGEEYSVHEDVWAATGLGFRDGMLCIGCLERRIGRLLEPKDFFLDAPLNLWPGRSARLESRLSGSRPRDGVIERLQWEHRHAYRPGKAAKSKRREADETRDLFAGQDRPEQERRHA
jgi:hypothetical protein